MVFTRKDGDFHGLCLLVSGWVDLPTDLIGSVGFSWSFSVEWTSWFGDFCCVLFLEDRCIFPEQIETLNRLNRDGWVQQMNSWVQEMNQSKLPQTLGRTWTNHTPVFRFHVGFGVYTHIVNHRVCSWRKTFIKHLHVTLSVHRFIWAVTKTLVLCSIQGMNTTQFYGKYWNMS